MRFFAKLLVFLLLIGLAYITWYVYGDSRLSNDAKSTLLAAAPAKNSDGFIYLLGIGAPIGEDPVLEGEKLLSEIRMFEKKYSQIKNFSSNIDFKYDKSLKLPKSNGSFCRLDNRECLDKIFAKKIRTEINESELKVIGQRFDILLAKTNFKSQLQPHYFEPLINSRFIFVGSRLKALQIIKEAQGCCPKAAVLKIYDLIERYKHYTEHSDTLIDKILGHRAINDSIEILFRLQKEHQLTLPDIPLLSASQLSLDEALNKEFAIIKSIADIINHAEVFNNDQSYGDNPKWVNTLLKKLSFKKNLSLNKILILFENIKEISTDPISNYAENISKHLELKKSLENHSFHNAGGVAVLEKQTPSLNQFFSGFNINAKISLFNQLIKNSKIDLDNITIDNSFFPNSPEKIVYDETNHKICLDNPVEDKYMFSCLYL